MKAAWLERRGKAEPRLTVGERTDAGSRRRGRAADGADRYAGTGYLFVTLGSLIRDE